VLFPVLWLDEGIELGPDLVGTIRSDLIDTLLILDIVQWTLVGVGAAMIVIFLIWYIIALRNAKKKSTSVDPIFTTAKE